MVGGGVSATCYRPYQNCRDLSSFMKLSFTFCNILLTYVYTHMQTHTEGEKERETFHGYVKKSIPELRE